MDRTAQKNPRQGGHVEGTRPALAYAQIPLILLRLPTGERAAAIEVWATLHQHIRLGATGQKISDEMLSQSPYLEGRSVEHARKGLEILERLELIARTAKGSSRRVALLGRLKSHAKPPEITKVSHNCRITVARKPPAPTPETDATVSVFFFPCSGT